MRNNGTYGFGPSLRKTSKKKKPTELMKKVHKQLKRTRQYFRGSMSNTFNNDIRQGDGNVCKRETSYVRLAPRTNNLTSFSRASNRVEPLSENFKESMPPNSRIVRKNMSRPSSLKPSSVMVLQNGIEKPNNGMNSSNKSTNGGAPPLKNIEKPLTSSSRPNNNMDSLNKNINDGAPLLKNIEKPRTSSSRPNNIMDSLNKNRNGGAPLLRNIEKPKTSSSRKNNGEAYIAKNTEVPRSSSLRPNNDTVSTSTNIEKPNNGLVPFGKNNESLKSRPSHPKKGFSSVPKDDSNSIPKKSHPSPIFGNSRISAKKLNGEAQKEDTPTTIEASNLTLKLNGNKATGSNMRIHSGESMDEHIQLDSRKRNVSLSEDGETIGDKLRKRKKPLRGENIETDEDDDTEEPENCRPTKRRRKLILIDYEDDDDGDQNLAGVKIGTAGLPAQTDVLKMQQYCSLPIDEPVWSGIIRISSSKSVSLAAHLSTKCCKEVWNLAGSLQQEIIVTKLSRMEAWPKSFEASRPTDNDIALYFLPCGMRQDADLDQLVKEVVENDMVLQAVIGEAEMLIFPSILLPGVHQTFQGKPYLWAVFKRRKNKVATAEVQLHGKGRCAQDEIGKQQASNCIVGKEGHRVTGVSTDIGLETPEEMERQGTEQEQNTSLARDNTPSPATKDPTVSATTSANLGQTHTSLAVPAGAVFGFVVHRNQRTEQLLREMQREGAVVVAMQGEMVGSGLGQATATGRGENEMTPSSSGRAAMV